MVKASINERIIDLPVMDKVLIAGGLKVDVCIALVPQPPQVAASDVLNHGEYWFSQLDKWYQDVHHRPLDFVPKLRDIDFCCPYGEPVDIFGEFKNLMQACPKTEFNFKGPQDIFKVPTFDLPIAFNERCYPITTVMEDAPGRVGETHLEVRRISVEPLFNSINYKDRLDLQGYEDVEKFLTAWNEFYPQEGLAADQNPWVFRLQFKPFTKAGYIELAPGLDKVFTNA